MKIIEEDVTVERTQRLYRYQIKRVCLLLYRLGWQNQRNQHNGGKGHRTLLEIKKKKSTLTLKKTLRKSYIIIPIISADLLFLVKHYWCLQRVRAVVYLNGAPVWNSSLSDFDSLRISKTFSLWVAISVSMSSNDGHYDIYRVVYWYRHDPQHYTTIINDDGNSNKYIILPSRLGKSSGWPIHDLYMSTLTSDRLSRTWPFSISIEIKNTGGVINNKKRLTYLLVLLLWFKSRTLLMKVHMFDDQVVRLQAISCVTE